MSGIFVYLLALHVTFINCEGENITTINKKKAKFISME